jgi:hypothetical protein
MVLFKNHDNHCINVVIFCIEKVAAIVWNGIVYPYSDVVTVITLYVYGTLKSKMLQSDLF